MKHLSKNSFDFIPNMPKLDVGDDGACFSFMFYDSERRIDHKWVEWVETLFSKFELEPDTLILHHQGKTRKGNYNRIRKALLNAVQMDDVDFQIRSRPEKYLSEFFPSEVSVSMNTSGPGKAQGVISIIEKKITDTLVYSEKIASELILLAGNFYAHSSKFPLILGPDAYAAAVGTIPRGWSFVSTKAYNERLTTWRKATRHLDTIENSFREIFPISFLKKSHLSKTIAGIPAKQFYENYGSFRELVSGSEQYMWVLEDDKLNLVRKMFEKEGLILSFHK